jgi:hypothetical protein
MITTKIDFATRTSLVVLPSKLAGCSRIASAEKAGSPYEYRVPQPKLARRSGKPVSYQLAKEVLMGLASAEVDCLAETKRAEYIDCEKAKRHASDNASQFTTTIMGSESVLVLTNRPHLIAYSSNLAI